jgi:hypothetical protein
MQVTVNRGINLGWLSQQYAYPFSFPVGAGTGQTKTAHDLPYTYGDLMQNPAAIFPVIVAPVIILMLVWKVTQ